MIDTVEQVREEIKKAEGKEFQNWLIRQVMKRDLYFSYRKISKLAPLSNNDRCRILR